jgi:hypothetical protein
MPLEARMKRQRVSKKNSKVGKGEEVQKGSANDL